MPDPITDLKNGVSDTDLKKRYKLNDDAIFTLRKYDYVTTKGGLSETDALEMYPDVSKYLSKPDAVKEAKVATQNTSYKSVLPKIDSPKPASESTSVNQPAQSLDKLKTDIRNEPQKIADQQALVAGENIMRNTQITEAKNNIAKATGVPASLQPIKQPIVDIPEQVSQNEIDNQKKADEAYKTPFGKMYYNVIQPVATGGGKFLGNAMGAVKRLEGYLPGNDKEHYNNMADDLVNFFDNKEIAKSSGKNAYLYSEPTKLQGNLINDGKVNTSKIIPSTIENLTTMAGYVFGGEALGGGKAGLLASTYLGTEEDYRKTGKAAGLKGGQLDAFANISAGITSAIFMGLPAEQLAGKAQAKFATEAAKDIAEGMTVKQAVKKGAVDLLKATGHTSATLLGVNAADHAVHSAVDAMKDQPVFNDDISFKAIKDEVAGTLLTAVLTTPLMMAPGMLRHYTPDAQVKSSLLYASQNLPEFSSTIDKGVAAGSYTPEQGQLIKDNIGKFSTQVTQLSEQGYSPDQATRMAWSAYKDGKITQNSKVVHDNPILKETIGKEAEKDREVLKNDIKDAALGIPEAGSEITGDELKTIIKNTPNSGDALLKKVEGNTYKVDEINLQDKYNNEPSFKKSVDEFEKSKEDPEGLRTPAIVDAEGKVLDGNKRLVQQYVNGEKNARVFKELKNTDNATDVNGQNRNDGISAQPESTGGSVQGNDLGTTEADNSGLSSTVPPLNSDGNKKPISGISPDAQSKLIATRQSKTSVSPRQESINNLIDEAKKYNDLPKGRLGKQKPEGLQQLNSIKLKAKELELTFDDKSGKFKNKSGGKVQQRFLDIGNGSIIDNHTPLSARPAEVQDTFKSLYEHAPDKSDMALYFPNDVIGVDGKLLSPTQLQSALSDISHGIPSVQAEKYLNALEGMVTSGEITLHDDGQVASVPLKDYMELMTRAKQSVDEALAKGDINVPDDVMAEWVKQMDKEMSDPSFQDWQNNNNLADNGTNQEPQTNSKEQASNTRGDVQPDTRQTAASPEGDLSEVSKTGDDKRYNEEIAAGAVDFEAPLEKNQAKAVADKLRSWAKLVEGDTSLAKSDLLALPKAVISTALKGAAELIEAGATVAKAISHAVDAIRKHYEETGKDFDLKQTKSDVKDLFKSLGIIPKGEELSPKENIKRSTSTVVKDKVMENEMSALKRQIKDKYRNLAKGESEGLSKGKAEGFVKGMIEGFKKGIREGSAVATKAQKEFETHVSEIKTKIGDMLKAAEDRGVFSSTTKAEMVSSIAKTLNNAKSPLQLLKAMERVAKIINDVEYDKHYNEATSLKSKIAKVIKGKSLDRSASNKETVKAFLKIKPDDVTDIKVYNDIAEKILSTQKAVSVKVVDGRGVISNEAYDIANRDIRKYTDEQLTHAEELAKTRTAENYQDLVDIGVIDPATMSLKEMQDVIDSVNSTTATPEEILALDNAKQAEKERAMASLIEMQQSALQDMHDSIKDLDILTPQGNEIIKKILDLNPADLSLSQMVKMNDVINNIVVNGELYGAGDIAVIHDMIKDNAQMKVEIDKSGIDLSKFSNVWYDKILKGVASIHLVFDFIAKSSKLASRMQQLSGIHDIFSGHAKATVTQERTLKEYQDLKNKFGNKIDDPENRYRRGVYARVIQELGGSPENIKAEFDRVKGLIQHSYERLLRSDVDTEVQEGKIVEKVYKELLEKSDNADQVKSALQKIEPNNIKLVDFWINKFEERADDVAASSEIYNNKIFERYNNYTATKAKAINGSSINAEGEDIFKATMLSKKLDASPSKTKMNRIKSSVLPANTVYDLDFDSVQGERFYDTNYDLETAPHIAKVRAFFSTPESEKLLGGSRNKKFVMESIKNAVLKQKNKQLQAPELERNIVRAVNILQAKGARIALGSISQLPKQYISVASSTVANLGTDMGLYFQALRVSNKIKLFDQSSIAMRGDTKAGYNHDMDIASIDRSVLGNSFVRNSRQALSTMAKVAETAMSALVKSDVSVARTSWLSYYMQDLKKQGVDINKIDWNKAHEDYNKEAGAYAEQMVSRSQNPNNNTELGSLYRDTKGGSMILKNMILPFSSFAVNQRVRMTNDLQKLIKGGNKSEAARSLAATFLEQGIFNAIKVYALGALTTAGARGLASAFGFWDDQDEKKVKAHEDIILYAL